MEGARGFILDYLLKRAFPGIPKPTRLIVAGNLLDGSENAEQKALHATEEAEGSYLSKGQGGG